MTQETEAAHPDATNAAMERVAITPESVAIWAHALIPMIREVIRQELKALKPLDEAWYEPSEVEAMSCGKLRAETVRNWFRWGMIDGESDGRQVRLYQSTVEELRKTNGVLCVILTHPGFRPQRDQGINPVRWWYRPRAITLPKQPIARIVRIFRM